MGENLVGMWAVTSHLAYEGRCSGTPNRYSEPAFLKFVAGETDGQPHVQIAECTDAAGTTCNVPSSRLYTVALENGARYELFTARQSGSGCQFRADVSDAYEDSFGLFVVYGMYDDFAVDVPCTLEEAERRLAGFRCFYRSEIRGERR